MKNFKHLFTALLLLCVTTTATALDFKVNRIGYNITDATNMTVEVTRKGTSTAYEAYNGDVIIPEFVVFLGNTYRVTGIGEDAFNYSGSLTSVVIPNSVTSIGERAFDLCTGLASIEIPNSVTSIGNYAFRSCTALASIEIPNSVTSIGAGVFSGCSGLTSIEIPNSVTSIGKSAFYGCKGLTSIEIPNSVTRFGDNAFKMCTGLTSIVIPNSVTSIGEYAFSGCSGLTSIEIPNSVTSIGNYVFEDCSGLTSIEIPNSVTSIGGWVFSGCSGLTSIEIPNSVTSIGSGAFDNTAWYNNQTDGVIYAGKVLYKYKGTMPSNTSITINEGTLGIANYAFGSCTGLTSVVIPNSVTSIGSYAFYYCKGLTSIEIPNSVTSIGYEAFYNCTGLTSITSLIPADALFTVDSYTFYNVDKNVCTLYVPVGSKSTYASTAGWNKFTNIVELEPTATEVTVTIGQYGNATYCSPYALDFSNVEGLKAYAATGYNKVTQVVTLTRLQTAEAGVGLFLKGEPGEYTVPVIEYSNDYSLNLLVGTLEQTTVNSTDGAMSNYKFTITDGDEAPMFYPFEDNTTFSAGKAYLQIPTAWLPATAQKSVSIRFDEGETTDIDELEGENGEVKTVYDLQGRVVENPTSGIYIINGKKVVIR